MYSNDSPTNKSNASSNKQALADAERAALVKKKRAEEYEKCKKDLQCWGDKHALKAIYACEDLIEKRAKVSFKWTDGILGSKITHFRWKDKNNLTLTYFGDKIQFQNGFGAWQDMTYQCDYDPVNEKLLSVGVKPGRF